MEHFKQGVRRVQGNIRKHPVRSFYSAPKAHIPLLLNNREYIPAERVWPTAKEVEWEPRERFPLNI